MNYFDNLMSTAELSDSTGKSLRWIQQIAQELIDNGVAKRIGKPLICHTDAIAYIKQRPETRGRNAVKCERCGQSAEATVPCKPCKKMHSVCLDCKATYEDGYF